MTPPVDTGAPAVLPWTGAPGRQPPSAASLYGRRTERDLLDGLLAGLRRGHGGSLLLWGDPGVGKTALLDYLVNSADLPVVRVTGVEAESELAFAALGQLCGPLRDLLERLPGPQRAVLRIVLGLEGGPAPDRFLVGVAVLGLLSAASANSPLICCVDDAHLLDRASAQALAFAARRVAGPVLVVFAGREAGGDLAGLPELRIEGLLDADARHLLTSVVRWPLDERVAERIVAETRGNPLALLALPRGASAGELAGGFGLPALSGTMSTSRVERGFLRRVKSLPAETQRLLLLAAAEPTGDVTLLWRAAECLGAGADAAGPARDAGLIELGTRVRFGHPLLRAAVYRAASLPDRREVHRALAEATDPGVDPDRRAWHRARAVTGPDETVAAELERSAARAHSRAGVAAAAAFLQRAAELTPDPDRRAARALVAARAKFAAAAPDAARELLAMAELGELDALRRAELARLRARISFAERRVSDSSRLLLDIAWKLTPLDGPLARATYLEALGAAVFAGRLGQGLTAQVAGEAAKATETSAPAPQPPQPVDLLLDAAVTRLTQGYAAAVSPVRDALEALRRYEGGAAGDVSGWLWLASPFALDLWDDAAWDELATRAVRLARASGALAALPVALIYRAGVLLRTGEFGAAAELIAEAGAVTTATGSAPMRYPELMLAVWRGEDSKAHELIDGTIQDATARGEGRAIGMARYAAAVLYNGLGRHGSALVAARQACEHEELGLYGWSLAELVEAGARSGAAVEAAEALRQLSERTRAAGSQWGLGVEARSRALLSDGPAADALYREAIERLARSRITVEFARARLLYGEWLRREQRGAEAREHLWAAHEMFGRFGAMAFAERARHELAAVGETVRKPAAPHSDAPMTEQETQVARLAAEGRTNPEIAAQLFISPRTAEYHLHKVFAKLGISSRRQLRHHLKYLSPSGSLAAGA